MKKLDRKVYLHMRLYFRDWKLSTFTFYYACFRREYNVINVGNINGGFMENF